MAPSIERQPIDYLQQNKTVNIIPKGVVGAIWDQKLDRRQDFFSFFLEKIKIMNKKDFHDKVIKNSG